MSHVPIEETDLLRDAEEVSDRVWALVHTWTPFSQETVGKQFVRAADSIGANLVEGDGRYSNADSIHFFVIARASARETSFWLRRCRQRKLVDESTAEDLLQRLTTISKSVNGLINYRRSKAKAVREDLAVYDSSLS